MARFAEDVKEPPPRPVAVPEAIARGGVPPTTSSHTPPDGQVLAPASSHGGASGERARSGGRSISRRLLDGVQSGMERMAKRFEAVPHDEAVVLEKLGLPVGPAAVEEADSAGSGTWDGTSLSEADSQERVLTDYACALDGKVLLQGRLYVLTSYVGFYSNIMGYTTKLLLPLRDVTAVNKRRKLGTFPNTIEIICEGKSHRFTSFLRREDCYQAIIARWTEKSGYARLHLGNRAPGNDAPQTQVLEASGVPTLSIEPGAMETPETSRRGLAAMSEIATSENGGDGAHLSSQDWRTLTSQVVGQATASAAGSTAGDTTAAGGGLSPTAGGRVRKRERKHRGRKAIKAGAYSIGAQAYRLRWGNKSLSDGEVSEAAPSSYSNDDSGDLSGGAGSDASSTPPGRQLMRGKSTMQQLLEPTTMRMPTPVHPEMRKLASATYPCSVPHFFATFMADGDFEERLRLTRGDTDVKITPWVTGAELGEHMREITFVHPTGQSIGPKKTRCRQLQRYRLWTETPEDVNSAAVLVEASQTNLDIPFGDYFCVDTRFDVTPVTRPDGGPACQCVARGMVTFHKKTMFKGKIEKVTMSKLGPGMQAHLTEMQRVLADQMRGGALEGAEEEGADESEDMGEPDEARIARKLERVPSSQAEQIRAMLNLSPDSMPILETAGEALSRLGSGVHRASCWVCDLPTLAWVAAALLFMLLYARQLALTRRLLIDAADGGPARPHVTCSCFCPSMGDTSDTLMLGVGWAAK